MDPDASLQEEIRRFREQYQRNPASLVFARLADAWRRAGEPARSLEILRDGIARHPDYVTAHLVYARSLRDLGREEEAGRSFRTALELDPQNLVALKGLAELAREAGDAAGELRWVELLAQVDPLNPESRGRLASLRSAAGPSVQQALPVDEEPPAPAQPETPMVERDAESSEGPLGGIEPEISGEPVWSDAAAESSDLPEGTAESPWWFADVGDSPEEEEVAGDLVTRTMAELYLKQGLFDDAEAIFLELLTTRPEDEELLRGLEAARRSRAARSMGRSPAAHETEADRESRGAGTAGGTAEPVPPVAPTGPPFPEELRSLLEEGRRLASEARASNPAAGAGFRDGHSSSAPVSSSGAGGRQAPPQPGSVLADWLARLRGK